MHVHWTWYHDHACSTRLASLACWRRPTNTQFCITHSMQPRELGIHYLLQPTVTDIVSASSNTTRQFKEWQTAWKGSWQLCGQFKQLLFIWWTQQNTLGLLDQAMYTLICWSMLQSAPAYLFFISSTQLFLPAAEMYLLETANRALLPLKSTWKQLFALFNTKHCQLWQGTMCFPLL